MWVLVALWPLKSWATLPQKKWMQNLVDLQLMFIMTWRDPTLCYFLVEQAGRRLLSFSRHVLPQPDILSRDYIWGLCMLVRGYRRVAIPAFSQHISKSFLPCVCSKSDTGNARFPWCAHSQYIQCSWGSCACALLWIFTSKTNWMCPKCFGVNVRIQTISATHVP